MIDDPVHFGMKVSRGVGDEAERRSVRPRTRGVHPEEFPQRVGARAPEVAAGQEAEAQRVATLARDVLVEQTGLRSDPAGPDQRGGHRVLQLPLD